MKTVLICPGDDAVTQIELQTIITSGVPPPDD